MQKWFLIMETMHSVIGVIIQSSFWTAVKYNCKSPLNLQQWQPRQGWFILQVSALWHLEVSGSILDLVLLYLLLYCVKLCTEEAIVGVEKYSNLSFENGREKTFISYLLKQCIWEQYSCFVHCTCQKERWKPVSFITLPQQKTKALMTKLQWKYYKLITKYECIKYSLLDL